MADTLESLELEVKHSASGASGEIEKLASALKGLGDQLARVLPNLKDLGSSLKKINISGGDGIARSAAQATAMVESADPGFAGSVKQVVDVGTKSPLNEELQETISSAGKLEIALHKAFEAAGRMKDAFQTGNESEAWRQRERALSAMASAAKSAGSATKSAASGVKELTKESKKSEKPLGNLISSLKRIAFYRIIRGAIKAVTQAFQEGLEKAYLFSQGIEGEGHRFAESLDRMKSAGNAMKGQLGAAFIGLLAAVEPILVSLINIITAVADAISQLIAAFTGGTYLKANQTAAQFADTMARGGGAAKEWKNQLLGFDEINRLNEPNKGGGGGGTDPLAGYEFVETPIAEKWKKIAETLRPILDGIKLMFKGLSDFVWGFLNGDWAMVFSGLGTIVAGFGQTVSGVITFVRDIIDDFFLFVEEGIVELGKKLDEKLGTGGTFEKIGKVIADVFEGIRKIIHEALTLVADDVSHLCGIVSDLLKGDFSGAWEHAKALLVEDTNTMGYHITKMAIETAGGASKAGSAVRELSGKVAGNLAGAANATADFADVASTNLTTVRSQIAATGQSGLQAIGTESGISFVARIANAVGVIKRMIAGGFAGGGFPPEGQFFFAGEAGPELVGTMGGRTAVANQQEITEGIRQAVYDAMLSASNNGNNDVSVKVYLDSKEIKAGQQRLNRAWGV